MGKEEQRGRCGTLGLELPHSLDWNPEFRAKLREKTSQLWVLKIARGSRQEKTRGPFLQCSWGSLQRVLLSKCDTEETDGN